MTQAHISTVSTRVPLDTSLIVAKLRSRGERDLHSIVQFSHPFSKADQVLLVVLAAEARNRLWVYEELWHEIVDKDGLLCLRVSELAHLGLPGPVVTMASLPYWVKTTGRPLYGADPRHEIGVAPCTNLLRYHLDRVRSSRDQILHFLVKQKYRSLDAYLVTERHSLMYAALFSRGIWHVSPDTLAQEFTAACADAALREHLGELNALSETLTRTPDGEQKAVAYKAVWLFETFLSQLSTWHP